MPSSPRLPRSYTEALAMLKAAGGSNCQSARISKGANVSRYIGVDLRTRGSNLGNAESIAVVWSDAGELVTFYRDGRIKIKTLGRNDFVSVQRISGCLPKPYGCRKRGCHVALIDRRRRLEPIAEFLSSTTFMPETFTAKGELCHER